MTQHPEVIFIRNQKNTGLCKSFNNALQLAEGKYIIDLSGDDILLHDRIEQQVRYFEFLPESYGAIFSNAVFINHASKHIGRHFPVDSNGKSQVNVPSGYLFKEILSQYFICTPTLMFRKSTLLHLTGYDENLTFEDFDILIRLSRSFLIGYQDKILTQKRIHASSQSATIIRKENQLLLSTFLVCQKAYQLCQTESEHDALHTRIRTFIRKCYYTDNFELAVRFSELYNKIRNTDYPTYIILWLCKQKISVNYFYVKFIMSKRLIERNLPF